MGIAEFSQLFQLAMKVGLQDLQSKYRKTIFRLLWVPIGFSTVILVKAYVFSNVFEMGYVDYLLYLSSGLAVWFSVVGFIADSPNFYIGRANMVVDLPLNLTFLDLLALSRRIYDFLLTIPIFCAIALVSGKFININILLFVFNFTLVVVAFFPLTRSMSSIGVIFRDLGFFSNNLFRGLFFVTPVFWEPSKEALSRLVIFNPFHHVVELLRSPLLGKSLTTQNYMVLVAIFSLGFLSYLVTRKVRAVAKNFI